LILGRYPASPLWEEFNSRLASQPHALRNKACTVFFNLFPY
jgi:hypothetical protein